MSNAQLVSAYGFESVISQTNNHRFHGDLLLSTCIRFCDFTDRIIINLGPGLLPPPPSKVLPVANTMSC